MSEVHKAWSPEDNDWRGDILNDEGVFRFHPLLSPNTSAPDVIESAWARRTDDPAMPVTGGASQVNAARSRHPGGVNVAMCDSSLRFVADSVDFAVWQAQGSMNGLEVKTSD
jgi:prepilin-type processing-associated H-X9-DG protein